MVKTMIAESVATGTASRCTPSSPARPATEIYLSKLTLTAAMTIERAKAATNQTTHPLSGRTRADNVRIALVTV